MVFIPRGGDRQLGELYQNNSQKKKNYENDKRYGKRPWRAYIKAALAGGRAHCSVLQNFDYFTTGGSLQAGLVQGTDGALYGTASEGGTLIDGSTGYGTVFKLNPNGSGFTVLLNFDSSTTGAYPYAGLIQGADGNLYGTTSQGGDANAGTVFRLVFADTPPPNTPPVAKCKNVTVSAGTGCTTVASIDDGSFDPDTGDTITLAQTPAGPYSLGPTTVTLTVTDNHAASSSCQATVTVVDNTPPAIGNCPANQSVNATSPAGVVVTFTSPGALDNCSVASVSSSPASGSTFPIGVNTVTFTATDGSANHSSCTFTVKVKSAAEQVSDLKDKVSNLSGVKSGVKNSLVAKLNAALAALSVNDTTTACARMQDFINICLAQKKARQIPATAADELITDATRIRAVIGCP